MFNLFNVKKNLSSVAVFRLAILIVFFSLTFLILTSALTVNAQLSSTFEGDIVPCGVGKGALDCQFCHFQILAQNIMNFLVFLAIVVAVLMFVFAGFLLVTAGANEGQLSQGKKIFWSVFIGLFIVLAAWLIIDTLMKAFYRGEGDEKQGFGPWNKIECAAGTSLGSADDDDGEIVAMRIVRYSCSDPQDPSLTLVENCQTSVDLREGAPGFSGYTFFSEPERLECKIST